MLGFALLTETATSSVAAPITFNFTFASGGATAAGFITFESTLLPNPGSANFTLPNPAVLALQVTVSGATAGNGTFGIGSFGIVLWSTNGVTLDLSQSLIGQAGWGPGVGGDFNLFGTAPAAPAGVAPFVLGANLGQDISMTLSQMAALSPTPTAVPALDAWKLVVLALLVSGVGIVLNRRRHAARLSV